MRQHFIPQFLLSAWSKGSGDGKLQVFRLDLPGTPTNRRTPKHTGYEENLVALSRPIVAGMEQHAVETRFLKLVDDDAAKVRDKMLRDGLRSLTVEDRSEWSRFMVSLRVRQPKMVQELRLEAARRLRESLEDAPEEYAPLAGDPSPLSLLEWTEKEFPGLIENYGLSLFAEIASSRDVAERIFRMKWWLWDFTTGQHDLLLSDNPCIFTGGLDEPDVIVALPITPKVAFMATKGARTADKLRTQTPTALATLLNESSLSQAITRIYARSTAPMSFIKNRCLKG